MMRDPNNPARLADDVVAQMTPGLRAWYDRDPQGVTEAMVKAHAEKADWRELETAAIFAGVHRPHGVPSYSIHTLAFAASADFGHEHLGYMLSRETIVRELHALADLFDLVPRLSTEERQDLNRLVAENDTDRSYSKLWQRLQPLSAAHTARVQHLVAESDEKIRKLMAERVAARTSDQQDKT